MNRRINFQLLLFLLALILFGCGPGASLAAQSTGVIQTTATKVVIPPTGIVRRCEYVPGVSIPAEISPQAEAATTPDPAFEPYLFHNSEVEASTIENELELYRQIWEQIDAHYASPSFNGADWDAIRQEYEAQIQKGLAQADFYLAMKAMLFDLDGGYSGLGTPAEMASSSQPAENQVGIGLNAFFWQKDGQVVGTITGIQPGGPAEQAGLKIHDTLLKVEGGPVLADTGQSRSLGQEGTMVTITMSSPGQPARELTLVRAQPPGLLPQVDYCLVSGTHIGYIRLVEFYDRAAVYQMSDALEELAAEAPLDGLVIDTRMASGIPEIAEELLAFYISGELGRYDRRNGSSHPFSILPAQGVSGSQSVPLVVLQDETSGVLAATFGGILELNGLPDGWRDRVWPLLHLGFLLFGRWLRALPAQRDIQAGRPLRR
jgi:C-terminal processing protease CtpA/Prc